MAQGPSLSRGDFQDGRRLVGNFEKNWPLEVPRSCFEGVTWDFFHPLEVPILKQNINWQFIIFNDNKDALWKINWSRTWHERGTKKKSESPTGIEPMTSRTPIVSDTFYTPVVIKAFS